MVQRQQVIDDIEALLAVGIVDTADVDELLEEGAGIIVQPLHQPQQQRARDGDRELAVRHFRGDHVIADLAVDQALEVDQCLIDLGLRD